MSKPKSKTRKQTKKHTRKSTKQRHTRSRTRTRSSSNIIIDNQPCKESKEDVIFPPIEPYKKIMLKVDTITETVPKTQKHPQGKREIDVEINVELVGNPKGYPVIYLHGGPGDYITPFLRRIFNPKKYNIILFDQRGTGKSRPLRETRKNTTQDLIADMEKIRTLVVGVDKWIVSGGSWGSALAVLYAQAHPKCVAGLLLRGFTDLNKSESLYPSIKDRSTHPTSYFNASYMGLYPEVMDSFYKHLNLKPKTNGRYIISKLHKMSNSKNKQTRKRAARIWSNTGSGIMYLNPKKNDAKKHEDTTEQAMTLTKIDLHYIKNDYFLTPNQIVQPHNIEKIKNIPTIFVHGRYDVICPLVMAYDLHKQLNKSKLCIVKAGHTYYEPEISKVLIRELDELHKMCK